MNRINRKIYLDKIIQVMKNDYPLIKNLKLYGFYDQFSKKELNYVFSGIFEQPVNIRGRNIFNQNLKRIYKEFYSGSWVKFEYDKINAVPEIKKEVNLEELEIFLKKNNLKTTVL